MVIMKLSIIIPCYNEKQTIESLIKRVKQAILPVDWTREIIISDDFSTDGTRDILKNYQSDCIIVFKEQNRGKGAAIKAALPMVTGDYIIIQDADLEYNPDNYLKMLEPIVKGESRVVFGSRLLNKGNKPFYFLYYYGGWLLTKIFNFLFSVKLTDLATCYKLFPASLKSELMAVTANDFVYDVVELTYILAIFAPIKDVSIIYEPRSKEEGKKINWRHGLKCFWAIFRIKFSWLNAIGRLKLRHYLIFISFFVSLSVLLPVFQIGFNLEGGWQGVPPEYTNDGLYYYTRLNEVGRGNFYLSNPYFLDYSAGPVNLFVLPDWLASLPMLMGLSLVLTVIFNALFWGILFTIILFWLFKKLAVNNLWSCIFSLAVYLQVYNLMLKPAVMQIIYTLFVLFLLFLWQWLKNPNAKNSLFVFITAAVCFYSYPYLLISVALILILSVCWLIFFRKNDHFKAFKRYGWLVVFFSLPFFILFAKQISLPFYDESIRRIILINSHMPEAEVFYYGRWVVLGLIVWVLNYYLSFRSRFKEEITRFLTFFSLSGLALLIGISSNVLTGQDLDLGAHFGRFITVWFALCLFVAIYFFIGSSFLRGVPKLTAYFIMALIFLGLVNITINFWRANPFLHFDKASVLAIQPLAEPLKFLDHYEKQPAVIWSVNSQLSLYVPVLTKHYVLFPLGDLHFHFFNASTREIAERYLTQHYFDDLNELNLKNDTAYYRGSGETSYLPKALNRQKFWCQFFNLSRFNFCLVKRLIPENVDLLLDYYQKSVRPSLPAELKKFNVSYLVWDRAVAPDFPDSIKTEVVFDNGQFVIYKFLEN